ncbi:hypothetical protein [Bifidobacterium sp.]|jgi:hypothetical protein|uniref:hypothetical protein n=1 Tax=Bifidobacterium sp. TaxID=41200 RepID=UPI0025C55ACB|nr:hypothetical protein [Bifidobacterium sp.]MCI1635350.1 hypothetical protein [Bifidobacterium sp.]
MFDNQHDEDTIRLSTVADEDQEDTTELPGLAQSGEFPHNAHNKSAASEQAATAQSATAQSTSEQSTSEQSTFKQSTSSASSKGSDVPLYTYTKATGNTNGEVDAHGNLIIRKQGPSTATVVFGSFLLVCGIIGFVIAWYSPYTVFDADAFQLDWRAALALVFGAIGAVLLISSLFWAVSAVINRAQSQR